MTRREKILAAIVLVILLAMGARSLWGRYGDMLARRESQLFAARQRLAAAKLAIINGRHAAGQLEAWNEQSLPADPDVAHTLYRSWLLDQFKAAGLVVNDIQPNPNTSRWRSFRALGYVVEARGSLTDVAALLHAFYRAPQLQQVTRLWLRPGSGSSELNFTMHVEALQLPGAARSDALPEGTSERFELAELADYQQTFRERNPFASYTPPRPEPPPVARQETPPPPKFDDAQHAYVTAIIETGGQRQVWITVRTTGEVLRLIAGDEVNVGLLEGHVVSIGPRNVVVQTGDGQVDVGLGHHLRDGRPVATDGDS